MPYLNRKHIRLKDFDYAGEFAYFITICTANRENFFWKNKAIYELNRFGNIVNQCWLNIPVVYENVLLDEFIIMPNHIHGIIIIENNNEQRKLGYILSQFKSSVTKEARKISNDKKLVIWQRNYHEHVIREKEIKTIRWYIANNPYNIEKDRYRLI